MDPKNILKLDNIKHQNALSENIGKLYIRIGLIVRMVPINEFLNTLGLL